MWCHKVTNLKVRLLTRRCGAVFSVGESSFCWCGLWPFLNFRVLLHAQQPVTNCWRQGRKTKKNKKQKKMFKYVCQLSVNWTCCSADAFTENPTATNEESVLTSLYDWFFSSPLPVWEQVTPICPGPTGRTGLPSVLLHFLYDVKRVRYIWELKVSPSAALTQSNVMLCFH